MNINHKILMIVMKIEFDDNIIIIYLYRYSFNFDDKNNLNNEIKKIFVKLIKKYNLDLFGYSKVNLYKNKNYGSVLEIEKIYNNDYNLNIIDLKVLIHEDNPFYLEMNDYYFDSMNDKIINYNGKYYLNLNDVNNIYKIIEFGKIIYKKMF